MKIIKLEGNTSPYQLRPIAPQDLEWVRKLHNDQSVLSMLTDPTTVTPRAQKRWYLSLQKSKTSKRWVVLYNGERIGIVRTDALDFNNKSVCIGLDIHKDFRGHGHGKNIYLILFEYFFLKLKLHRCWLFVADYNKVAHALYLRLGFKEEGRARGALYRFQKYHDYILMGILREEYLALKDQFAKVNYELSLD